MWNWSQISPFETRPQSDWVRQAQSLCWVHQNWDLVTQKSNIDPMRHMIAGKCQHHCGSRQAANLCCMCYPREVLKSIATPQMLPSCFKVESFISRLEGEDHSRHLSMLIAVCLPRCTIEAQNCISKQIFKSSRYVEICCLFHINKSFWNVPWFIFLCVYV